jgi:hypothetical protein
MLPARTRADFVVAQGPRKRHQSSDRSLIARKQFCVFHRAVVMKLPPPAISAHIPPARANLQIERGFSSDEAAPLAADGQESIP